MVENVSTWLEKAVGLKLQGDAVLMSKITGVYDAIPTGAKPPYIQIHDLMEYQRDCLSSDGYEFYYNIHVWSQHAGNKEVFDILQDVKRILHKQKINGVVGNTTSYQAASLTYEYSQVYISGEWRHGVIRFRIYITPTV